MAARGRAGPLQVQSRVSSSVACEAAHSSVQFGKQRSKVCGASSRRDAQSKLKPAHGSQTAAKRLLGTPTCMPL
jgi:hypothetical protein